MEHANGIKKQAIGKDLAGGGDWMERVKANVEWEGGAWLGMF
jgi:hypothetical protein